MKHDDNNEIVSRVDVQSEDDCCDSDFLVAFTELINKFHRIIDVIFE